MFNTYIQEIGMRTITLMQYVFSIILLVIIFLVMDYFWKGDEFSWTYEFAKGGIGRNYHLPSEPSFIPPPS